MNLVHLLLIAFFAVPQAVSNGAPSVPVRGIVTDSLTGDPLPSVQVRFTSKALEGVRPFVSSAFTTQDGKFQLSMPPANYTVVVQRPGFFGVNVNSVPEPNVTRNIALTAGQPPLDLSFSLTEAGVITGVLSDENGRPLGNATVGAFQVRYQDGRPLLSQVRTIDTNELGEYRLYWIPPGDYLVGFSAARSNVGSATIVGGPESRAIQTRTYYPGTPDLSGARTVTVTSGKESGGVNFGVRTIPTFTISGRISNPFAPPPAPGAAEPSLLELPGFTLVNRDVVGAPDIVLSTFANALSLADRQKGLFELRAIPPGRYDLYGTISTPAFATAYTGRVSIEVFGQDLKDIVIPVHPPAEVRGRVVAEGVTLPEQTSIKLRSTQTGIRVSAGVETAANATGEFVFKALVEGTYRLDVALPPNSFVSDLRQGNQSIYGDGLVHVLDGSPVPVQVTIAANAGSVTGTLIQPEGRSGTDTTVVAIPEGQRRNNLMLFAAGRADRSGQFTVDNIAPGSYKFFAFESAMQSAWMNSAFLARYEEQGVPVTVPPGETTGLRVPVIWVK